MTSQYHRYSPPPRRRPSSIIRKDLYKRLRGKPTHCSTMLSIPHALGLAVSRVLILVFLVLFIAGFTLAGIGTGMLVGYISTAEEVVTEQIKSTNEATKIVDSDGNEIAILTGSQNINREYIAFSSVKSTYIDEAFIAIEDERFDEHIGIDPRRIGSAILSALINGGTATHGGSTITQQTVKLVSGDDEVSAQRKVQEWYKAIRLEQQKSKDEIMELYINLVPMGNSYVGIQSAAKAYFDKDATELNLVECAFLAGIPNRPSTYNPLTETGKRNALRRMRIVLAKMYELKMLTERQYKNALDAELVFRRTPMMVTSTQVNSYFVDYVIEEVVADLVEKRGYSEDIAWKAVYNNGLRIETTMDQDVQASIEETFKTQELFISDPSALIDLPEKPTGSIVVIENTPSPGQIKGLVGGYGEKTSNFGLNRAVDSHRQPGSSIKPLAVYGPGIDSGKITAASVFTDMELFLNPDEPTTPYPKNAYKGYKDSMTVRRAITISCNTIAAYIWQNVLRGETSLQYLKQVGIDRPTENYVAIALGGFNKGMSALEMAGGYATFANGGLYTEPYAYTRVLDADGDVLLEYVPEYQQAYKVETAFIITNILQDVLTGGTAAGYGLKNMPAAGKTGTTDENRDKWFCGFTPYYTAAVWYGYDNRLGQTKIRSGDTANAIKIWRDAMSRIHEGLERLEFETPKSVVSLKICEDSGMLATEYCKATRTEFFVPGAILNPKESCSLHVAAPTPTPEPTAAPTAAPTEPAATTPATTASSAGSG